MPETRGVAAMLNVKGTEEARRALEEIVAGIDEITEETLQQVGRATLELVKSRTPVRTGRLISNHRMQVTGTNSLRMWNDVEYAAYVEFGTSRMMGQPHWRPAIEELKRTFPRAFGQKGRDLVEDAVASNSPQG
ncbi:MAG TPA: HK97-gp10 family putative phage morphogenesis protein [Nitrososphaera sp.]